jgi:hypothetical protein
MDQIQIEGKIEFGVVEQGILFALFLGDAHL